MVLKHDKGPDPKSMQPTYIKKTSPRVDPNLLYLTLEKTPFQQSRSEKEEVPFQPSKEKHEKQESLCNQLLNHIQENMKFFSLGKES